VGLPFASLRSLFIRPGPSAPTSLSPISFPLIHLIIYLDLYGTDVVTWVVILSHQPARLESRSVRPTLYPHDAAPEFSSPRNLCVLSVSALDFSSALASPSLYQPAPTLSGSRTISHQSLVTIVFSYTYKLQIFYPLCFDIHASDGGVGGTALCLFFQISTTSIHPFYFLHLAHSFPQRPSHNPLLINYFRTLSIATGGVPPSHSISQQENPPCRQ
jgi:hypothetical protein